MYDIIFISYNEPDADDNFAKLQDRFPLAKRVHGVKGIHQAHIDAAKKAFTKMFWVVDADAVVLNSFKFDYEVPEWETDAVHVWHSINPINSLSYGYGGIKLLPKKLTLKMNVNNPDMTMSISKKFKVMKEVSNITAFNTDEFTTWRSAFRECAKLATIKDSEAIGRLDTWCKIDNGAYGTYAIAGAIAGRKYGEKNAGNVPALGKINDFKWLADQFSSHREHFSNNASTG
jgi:hypothetical protein